MLLGAVRGAMGLLVGLNSKPELNGRLALIVGPPTETGCVPCCLAPELPTDEPQRIAVNKENLQVATETPHVVATSWINLALAFRRAGALDDAYGAYEIAYELAPPGSQLRGSTLGHWAKLCIEMKQERPLAAALEDDVHSLMTEIFEPITSAPEQEGLACRYGYDIVPGFEGRQLHVGILKANGQPGQSGYLRQWIFASGQLLEVDLGKG
eukprot:4361746-Prymnesium_polylepis.1